MENNIDDFIEKWKQKNIPPLKRDNNWSKLKWHICKKGEPVNPISYATGGEIEIEQFGIIGWLYKVENKAKDRSKKYYYQCPLIEARETGTGKFGDWLDSVKKFVKEKYNTEFALCTITNGRLYRYCYDHNIPVAVNNILYKVKIK